jgi:hypothetical protein
MTDVANKAFGSPEQSVIELHHVEEGCISGGKQENEPEAKVLVEHLAHMVTDLTTTAPPSVCCASSKSRWR